MEKKCVRGKRFCKYQGSPKCGRSDCPGRVVSRSPWSKGIKSSGSAVFSGKISTFN